MAPYQERVVKEKADLDEKIQKLTDFMAWKLPALPIPSDESVLLHRQKKAMQKYSTILGKRIAGFALKPRSNSKP